MYGYRSLVVGLFVLFSVFRLAVARECALTALPINPIAADRSDFFVGISGKLELRFVNDKTAGEVTVFPEPPLLITNLASKANCAIDGGVWVRKSVFVSQDNKVLVTQEFSGSNDFLIFYNTETCQKLYEIDVSNSNWSIHGGDINVSKAGKPKPTHFHLNAACLPVK